MSVSLVPSAFVTTKLEVPSSRVSGVELLCVSIRLQASLDDPAFFALNNNERQRAKRFLRPQDALRYAATRVALREALAERLDVSPTSVQFERDTMGRPKLAKSFAHTAIDFNISHSGSYALIAIAVARRVGVDIQEHNPDLSWRALRSNVLAPRDEACVMLLPERARKGIFYDVWTAKEAFLKALGTGVTTSMTSFSVLGDEGGTPVAIPSDLVPSAQSSSVDALMRFDAAWCVAPAGYTASLAWTRDAS